MRAWVAACLGLVLLAGCDCGEEGDGEGAALSLESVTPATGPTAGGTEVTLEGSGFREGMEVFFGQAQATEVQIVAGSARVVTPPSAVAGLIDVMAVVGDDFALLEDGFEYVAAPEVADVEPGFGPVEGGTPILVTGLGFVDGATVRLGGSAALEATVVDAETIQTVTPPGPPGAVDVLVENPDGQVGLLEDGFEYRNGIECRIATTEPLFGATGVPIVGSLRVGWSTPVEAGSVIGRIALRDLGGTDVPVAVEMEGDEGAVIRPLRSLRYWRSYGLIIEEGVADLAGDACEAGAVAFSTIEPAAAPRALRPAAVDGLATAGDFAIVASATYRGLQVYDVSDREDVVLLGDLLTDQEPVSLVVRGDRGYAPAGVDGVLILDVTDPSTPAVVGRAGTPGQAVDAAPFERDDRLLLAVADGVEGVRLLDVTDPEGVRDLGAIDPSGARDADVRAVDIEGDTIGIANGRYGFAVASIADLEEPEILGTGTIGRDAVDVVVEGEVLYVAHGYYGAHSFDLGDPAELAPIGEVAGPAGPCTVDCQDFFSSLTIAGNELFVAAGRSGFFRVALDGLGGMTLDAAVATPGPAVRVAAGDGILVGGQGGLVVFGPDAEAGAEPVWFDGDGHGIARDVEIDGNHAYVGAGPRGLQTFSLVDPLAPALVDRDDSPGSLTADYGAFSVEAVPGLILLGERTGLVLFDSSTADDPVEIASLEAHDLVRGMAVDGSTLFACDDNFGMVVVDLSDPAEPRPIAEIPYEEIDPSGLRDQCYDLLADGGVLYMASFEKLAVIDVTDPEQPTITGEFPLRANDAVTQLALSGDYLFATTMVNDYEAHTGRTHRLQIFDVTESSTPVRVWISEDLGGAGDVAVAGDVAFVSAGRGIYVFDVLDPTDPVVEGVIATPGVSYGLAVGPDVLLVAELAGGLQAIATGPLPPVDER